MGLVGAIWGLLGVTLLLGSAVGRLTPKALEALASPLGLAQWALLVGWVGVMAYAEGYKGFQRGFSPRVAARARHLREHPTAARVVLAPLFCMAYFGAPAKRRAVSFGVTLAVVGLVVAVRFVPQPWRGIIDAGVVVGLGWGIVTVLTSAATAFGARGPQVDPEVV